MTKHDVLAKLGRKDADIPLDALANAAAELAADVKAADQVMSVRRNELTSAQNELDRARKQLAVVKNALVAQLEKL